MKRLLLFTLFISISTFLTSQEVWSLQKCVEHAIENSITVRQAINVDQNTQLTGMSAKHQRYPTLNGSTSLGINFGRTINPATNDFETENSLFQSLGFSSNVSLFAGGRIRNSIKQNKLDQLSTQADIQQAKNDIALNVALTYLNVLFAYENLANAQNRLNLTQGQLDQIDKFISAGTRPENERYDILAQIATDEQAIIQFENDVTINLLNLQQQILLDESIPFDIVRPDIDVSELEAFENYAFEAVYSAALKSQPSIRSAEYQLQSAEMGVDIARGQLMPTVGLGGSVGTNWSDLARQANGFVTTRIPQEGVYINGEQTMFEVESEVPTSISQIPYIDQLDNNFGYGFNIGVQIPIYNNMQSRVSVERAKLNIDAQKNANELQYQQLRSNIQSALTSARAARKTLIASEKAVEASQIAYDNAVKRFDVGVINSFEFLSAQNRLDIAKVNLIIAKYDYLFRNKVIEFYLGRGISLN